MFKLLINKLLHYINPYCAKNFLDGYFLRTQKCMLTLHETVKKKITKPLNKFKQIIIKLRYSYYKILIFIIKKPMILFIIFHITGIVIFTLIYKNPQMVIENVENEIICYKRLQILDTLPSMDIIFTSFYYKTKYITQSHEIYMILSKTSKPIDIIVK